MKFFLVCCIAAVMVCQVIAAPTQEVTKEVFKEAVAVPHPIEAPRVERSYGAPAPSYGAPQLSPPRPYTYQSPAPTIPCGQALVFSCAPSVAQAPCAAAPTYAPSYGGY